MMKETGNILALLDKLVDQQQELFAALPKAIAIAQTWPDAFLNGLNCSPRIVGVSYHPNAFRVAKYPKPYQDLRTITRTYLKREDGVEQDITIDEFFRIVKAGSAQ